MTLLQISVCTNSLQKLVLECVPPHQHVPIEYKGINYNNINNIMDVVTYNSWRLENVAVIFGILLVSRNKRKHPEVLHVLR